jgi:CAAX prenyl protease-like protein
MRLLLLGGVLWMFRRTYMALNWSASWVGLACGLVSFVVWMALLPEGGNARDAWPVALESAGSLWAAVWLIARTVGYVIAVPVAEELAFRGYLARRFWRDDADASQIGVFAWGAFLLSSVMFGAFHGQLWLAGTVAGMLFALALYRRRSIGDAVLAHATTNGLIAAYVFATGDWSAWS